MFLSFLHAAGCVQRFQSESSFLCDLPLKSCMYTDKNICVSINPAVIFSIVCEQEFFQFSLSSVILPPEPRDHQCFPSLPVISAIRELPTCALECAGMPSNLEGVSRSVAVAICEAEAPRSVKTAWKPQSSLTFTSACVWQALRASGDTKSLEM